MVKLVFCLRRRPDLTREQFQKYWLETHGPLVRERAKTIGALRYVQVHTGYDELSDALRASRGAPEPFDGVAELWFESAESLAAGFDQTDVQKSAAELLSDERNFIDLASSPIWLAEEHAVVE